METKDFYKNTIEKEHLIKESTDILRTCDYDYYSDKTYWCKQQMKDIQEKWKAIGSAGNKEKLLWDEFQNIQNQFWKHIKVVNKEMRLLEFTHHIGDLRDDFENAKFLGQWKKVKRLGTLIDEKEDKLMDLEYELVRLKEELGIK